MKILHLIWSMTNGGAENMLVDIINYQVKHEDVSLLVVNDLYDESIFARLNKRCQVKMLKRDVGSKNPFVILRLNAYLLTHHFDIVHLHNADMIKYLFVKCNYVRTVHNTNQIYHNYRWHKGIIAISDAVHDELLGLGIRNSIMIRNGVNFRLIKQRNNIHTNCVFRMVQVSRILFVQKGQDILVEALAKLKDKGIEHFHLDFIGTGPDMQKLQALIYENGLEENITLLGNQPREFIYSHLCDYDLFIQPSRFEGFGLTVAEAMGAKIPVLVSENEGPIAIIDKGKYGFAFQNKSVDACAKQIEYVMNHYPSQKFIDDAYEHVTKLYNVEVTAQHYLDLYYKIVPIC